jgi:flagellar biosynthesis/type III secretory pathway protein FliH
MTTFLQIFLMLNVFILGVLAVFAAQHARAHYKPQRKQNSMITPEKAQPHPFDVHLTPEAKERLVQASMEQFQQVLNQSAGKLQGDLGVTTSHINNLVLRLASEIVSGELEHYRSELSQLHEKTNSDMSGIRTEVAQHQSEIEAKMTQEVEAEKQKLLKQIDTKLGDAVASFLLEALQHNVDLGSQSAYLVAMLEEHKADFIKEVGNEVQPAG